MSFKNIILDNSVYYKDTVQSHLFNSAHYLSDSTYAQYLKFAAVVLTGCSFYLYFLANEKTRSFLVFIWACFVKPFTPSNRKVHNDHQNNLELFYKTQAKFYDTTREVLLQGRENAMKLAFSHLRADHKTRKLVWIDIGGGTGLNIEKMDQYVAKLNDNFEAVYLVDLSPSLCDVAKGRVAKHGWKNVHVICGDACDFEIPHQEVDLITYSYSLSMIPLYHSAIDHAAKFLKPDEGIICSVDFGVQSDSTSIGRTNTLGGLVNRHVPWFYRTFWRIWFECDKVFLDPSRREYLEYKFGTLKSINCYNSTLGQIPYYIWLGVNKQHDSQLMYRFNSLATESPYLAPIDPKKSGAINKDAPTSKALEAALDNVKKGLPYPSLFYQKQTWRVYYDELSDDYECFKNQYIYAFTWEDPREDAKILNLTSKDTVLAITSAGDNILSYASLGSNAPKRIHGVDLNPCQGHLVELKLAALTALSHEETWKLFGEGKIENFQELLIGKLAPHLSSNAFQYWMEKGPKTFSVTGKGLYDTGSTRWALRLARYVFKITGLSSKVEELCNAKTLNEQKEIWNTSIRPVLYSAIVGKIFVGNPVFLWKALGVPANQAAMMDTSILQYIIDTLDPIIGRSLVSSDNYFYYLTLKGHYTPKNCPDYLTKSGFKQLTKTSNSPLEGIRLHTDYLNNVLARLTKKTISVAVIMDHMDWFDPEGKEVDDEIDALHSALCDGGRVMLRTAAQVPWYIKHFEAKGFSCTAAATRYSGTSIDRVNMYASTWICTKIPTKKERQMSTLTLNK